MATLIFMGGFAIALTLYTFFFLGRRSKNMPDGKPVSLYYTATYRG
jgi:hypothetical protein